jgi:sec-independent protein translocase protein TatC
VLRLILVFGLGFEAPVFVVLLNLAGLLPARRLGSWWRGIVLGVFVFAAVATPTGDPLTMLALALPLVALIGAAYLFCVIHDRRRARRGGEPDYASYGDDETSPL